MQGHLLEQRKKFTAHLRRVVFLLWGVKNCLKIRSIQKTLI